MLRVMMRGAIVLGWVADGATLLALLFALLRRWPLASKTARGACFAGLSAFAVPVAVLLAMFATSALGIPLPPSIWEIDDPDPSQKAKILAESISELMNCGAFGFLAALAAGALWAIARWRIRRTIRPDDSAFDEPPPTK
jgi:hypothetical protein